MSSECRWASSLISQIVITEDLNIICIINACVVRSCMSAVHVAISLYMNAPTLVLLSMCFTLIPSCTKARHSNALQADLHGHCQAGILSTRMFHFPCSRHLRTSNSRIT